MDLASAAPPPGAPPMVQHGLVRVAAAVPPLRVADCEYNAGQLLDLMRRAEQEGVAVLLFPELCLTGYTCADLFQHRTLLDGARSALATLLTEGGSAFGGVAVVGLPLLVEGQLFNCA